MRRRDFALRNFTDKALKCARQPRFVPFYLQTYLVEPLRGRTPDFAVVSYPKCGRTWLMVLLDQTFRAAGRPGYRRDGQWFELPGGHSLRFEHEQGNWVPAPRRVADLRFDAERYRDQKVLFLVRDPRDVLISSWYHLTFREPIYRGTRSEFIREDLVGARKVVAFMNLWVRHRDIPRAFELLRYEDLGRDPRAVLLRVLAFLGQPAPSQDLLEEVITASSFDRMKEAEKRGASGSPWLSPGRRPTDDALKVRKGKVGGYREELSEPDIRFLDRVIRDEIDAALSGYAYDSFAPTPGNGP